MAGVEMGNKFCNVDPSNATLLASSQQAQLDELDECRWALWSYRRPGTIKHLTVQIPYQTVSVPGGVCRFKMEMAKNTEDRVAAKRV